MTIDSVLVDKAGLALIGKISKLSKGDAVALLQDFSTEEQRELLTLCKHTEISLSLDYHAKRRKCLAALRLLGASWTQIGTLYDISRQTVMQSAHRILGPPGSFPRLAVRCSYEKVAEYNAEFWKSAEYLESHPVEFIANWLAANTEES